MMGICVFAMLLDYSILSPKHRATTFVFIVFLYLLPKIQHVVVFAALIQGALPCVVNSRKLFSYNFN